MAPTRPAPRDAGPLAARLAADKKMIARVRGDLALDRAATVDAVAAARGSADGSDARGRAELQLTRLEREAGRLDDLARDLSEIAADAPPPALTDADIGALAVALDAERADLAHVIDAARAALAR